MEQAAINQMLYRPIKSGNQYDRYMPQSQCDVHYLQYGDTHIALAEMEKWVKKYAHQVKKLAPVLKGSSLEQTIQNIHQFLFGHVQYKIDGHEQRLKSPACTWATRAKGTDCKSYSIFASAILWNLGIKHYLRKVRQTRLNPDYWTHVYIIIPNDQHTGNLSNSYRLIDATLRNNKEVAFIEKKDIYMNPSLPIYGLAVPAVSGCNCTAPMYPQYPGQLAISLGQPAYNEIAGNATASLLKFINTLSQYSASDYSLRQLEEIILNKISQGRDPLIRITETGIYVDDFFVNLKDTFRRIKNAQIQGLGAEGSFLKDASGILETASPITSLISSILPKNFIENTFGAIFANGFDLSCWNSSLPPNKVAQDIQAHHQIHFDKLLQAISIATTIPQKETAINLFVRDAYIAHARYAHPSFGLMVSNNWSKCSKKGIQIHIDFQKKIKDQADKLINQLKAEGATITFLQVAPVEIVMEGKKYATNAGSSIEVPQVQLNNIASQPGATPVTASTKAQAGLGGTIGILAGIGILIALFGKKLMS